MKYSYVFNQSEVPSFENHYNYNPLIQWDKIYTPTNITNDIYYVEQLPIQRFYILFPKLLHYIIESSTDELKNIKKQLDDIFNEENRKNCSKYQINIDILMKLIDLIISVLSKDFLSIETIIDELTDNFNKFKVLINELLNLEDVILDIEKVKQIQFFISVICLIASEIFVTISKAGKKKSNEKHVSSLPQLLVLYQEILKCIVDKCSDYTKLEKKDIEMTYKFADYDCSDIISALVKGNQEIVNSIMRETESRQKLTHKIKVWVYYYSLYYYYYLTSVVLFVLIKICWYFWYYIQNS